MESQKKNQMVSILQMVKFSTEEPAMPDKDDESLMLK